MKNELFTKKYYPKILKMDKNEEWKSKLKNSSGFNKTPIGILSIMFMIFGLGLGTLILYEWIKFPASKTLLVSGLICYLFALFGFLLTKRFIIKVKKEYQQKIKSGKLSLAVLVTANESYLTENTSLPSAFFYTTDEKRRLDINYYNKMGEKLEKIKNGTTSSKEEKEFSKKLNALESKFAGSHTLLDVPHSIAGVSEAYIWAGTLYNAAPKNYFSNYSNTIIPFLLLGKKKEKRGWYEKLPIFLNANIWAD